MKEEITKDWHWHSESCELQRENGGDKCDCGLEGIVSQELQRLVEERQEIFIEAVRNAVFIEREGFYYKITSLIASQPLSNHTLGDYSRLLKKLIELKDEYSTYAELSKGANLK